MTGEPAASVRPMREGDDAAVRAMMRSLYRAEPAPGFDGETVLVAEAADGTLAGFVSLSLRLWAEGCAGTPVPYVEGWFVAPAERGRGIGRALMLAAEDWARMRGFRELGSDADLDNLAGIAAHGRLGFVRTTRLQFFRKELAPLDPAEILDAAAPPPEATGSGGDAGGPGGPCP